MPNCEYPQSPIKLPLVDRSGAPPLDIQLYNWNNNKLTELADAEGRTFLISGDPTLSGTTVLDGVEYNLKSMHFHAPSEHAYLTMDFPTLTLSGELHLVHQQRTNPANYLVIGLLFYIIDPDKSRDTGNVEIDPMFFIKLAFSTMDDGTGSIPGNRYRGSLTTPRTDECCKGPVEWIIPYLAIPIPQLAFDALFPVQLPTRGFQTNPGLIVSPFLWTKNW